MTISYVLAPIPKWYFADKNGNPLGNGTMQVKSSLNPSLDKLVYQTPDGSTPYTDPVVFDLNGTAGPFYWQLDSDNPDDLYFLDVYDTDGNPIFNINNYPIAGGGGGGGGGTTILPIKNIISNSSFINNIDSTSAQPISNLTFLSPSSHTNFLYPDLTFIQSGVSNAIDTVTFNKFTPLGTNPFSPDYVSAYYINYTCLNNASGEVFKGYRIPLCPFVNTMAAQTFSLTFYARANSGANVINIRLRQFFGSGGSPSADVTTTPLSATLTSSFVAYQFIITLPSVGGKTIGNSNDDGTYLEILMPNNQSTSIDIAKPFMFPGNIFPLSEFETFEEIASRIENPRTGDVKFTSNLFSNSRDRSLQAGWIPLNDGTIGNSSSNATTRANSNTWLLYKTLWENTIATYCPIYNSSGVIVVKGASALADWNNNNQIQLIRMLGRVPGATTTSINQNYTVDVGVSTSILNVSSSSGYFTGVPVAITNIGGAPPAGLVVSVPYYVILVSSTTIRLALSAEAAIAGTFVTFTDNGSGTNTVNNPIETLSEFFGEISHQLTIPEMPSHNHPGSYADTPLAGGGILNRIFTPYVSGYSTTQNVLLNIALQGGDQLHNITQPTSFWNYIIKL